MHDFSQLLHQSQPALQVLRAGPWSAAEGDDFPLHRHHSWELVYYHSGHIDCVIEDEIHTICPGVLYIIPPGVTHADIARTAYKSFWIQFETPDLPWQRSYVDDSSQNIGRLCAAVVREFEERALSYGGMTTLLLWQIHIHLNRLQERRLLSPAEQLVRHAEGIVAERLGYGVQDNAQRLHRFAYSVVRCMQNDGAVAHCLEHHIPDAPRR